MDDSRRVPREEFLAAVRGAPSLPAAAAQLGLTEEALLRRATRYLQLEVIQLETTPNVRWEEAHAPESMPADSPVAVLLCAKKLGARFNGASKQPTILDLQQELKIPRGRIERHVELLIQHGLLERDQLALEMVA